MATETTRLNVTVTPRSGRDEVVGRIEGPNGSEIRVRVTAPPDKGKANAAVCKLIAKELGIPKTAVSVAAGMTSHHKTLEIAAPPEVVHAWVSMLE